MRRRVRLGGWRGGGAGVFVFGSYHSVKAGRFTETPEGTLAEVAWRDFDCGEPPAWDVAQDRKEGR